MPINLFNFFKTKPDVTLSEISTNNLPNFVHPLENERLEKLKESSVFNGVLNFFGTHYANFTTIAQIPDRYFSVTPETFPRLYDLYKTACKKLEMQEKYTLFCTMDYTRNAKTIGTDDNCVIVIDSSCLEDFSDRQILALIGRELGHIKMKHITYLNAFDMIDDLTWSMPLGNVILSPTLINGAKGLFLEWMLVAEYTADRAAAIAADGVQPVMQNHLMTSGIENADDCQDYKLYTQISFSQNLSNFNRAAQIVLMGTLKTFPIPFVIPRMQELEKWSISEECQQNFPKVYADNHQSSLKSTKTLIKGQKVDLTKNNSGLTKILIGIGWDINQNSSVAEFDLDVAAFLLKSNGKVSTDSDFVFYGNLRHSSESVEHLGDNLTGAGDGDDEQIKVDLSKIPESVDKIDFTVTIYEAEERNHNFGQVKSAYIRIINSANGEELLRYNLSEDFSIETAIVVAEIYRYKGEWKFHAIGSGFKGGLAAICKNYGVDVE
ncbi:MAG: TerD family protein [Selenomonadaceae bacterium]|nr:TerD family protein [Selenomonadaceae bacterium]